MPDEQDAELDTPRRGRGRDRKPRKPRTDRDARPFSRELSNVFDRLRGGAASVELSRYDERDELPAFLRDVEAAKFSRAWVQTLYGGGKFQAIGTDAYGRVVAKADFRIEGAPRYPHDPTAPAAAASSAADDINPKSVYGVMMGNMLTMQTAMMKGVIEVLNMKKDPTPARDPVDDIVRLNAALRSAQGNGDKNNIGDLADQMRKIAALGAELGGADKSLAASVVDAIAPLAGEVAQGIRESRRAHVNAPAPDSRQIAGHIEPKQPVEASSTPEGEMASLESELTSYIEQELPRIARKASLGVDPGDAAVTFMRGLFEQTHLDDWAKVQKYAQNSLVTQRIRSELLNRKVDGAWVERFVSEAVEQIVNAQLEPEDDGAALTGPVSGPAKDESKTPAKVKGKK